MAKTGMKTGGAIKHKDRGGVKLQPRPSGTRLKRGDDDLLAELSRKAAKKKNRGGVKLQPRPKQSTIKRGDDDPPVAPTSKNVAKKKDRGI